MAMINFEKLPSKADLVACSAQVAVVGAGPAGLYATRSLLESMTDICVDVFDRLPTPYGLVRYGIAPDNQKMKSVTRILRTAFEHEARVRFFGNVCLGVDISRTDLLKHYDSVIYATGAQGERPLGIPGEDLAGSFGAKELVDWYNGHPDAAERHFPLNAQHVAVIGAGNVALDVARMLTRSPSEIASTDVPDRVLDALSGSQITDVHLISRRGPVQAKFTLAELREMGQLANADVVVRPEEVLLAHDDKIRMDSIRELRTKVEMLREWSQRPLQNKPRRIHFRFFRSPIRIMGESRVESVLLERNEVTQEVRLRGTGDLETISANVLFRSVGFQLLPLPGLPFDYNESSIPHCRGRVLDECGRSTGREYITGWAKRGPSGTVGNNRSDAAETVCSLLAELASRKSGKDCDPERILSILNKREVDYTNWVNWLQLDDHEVQLGRRQGRPRVKTPDLRSMLRISCQPDFTGSARSTESTAASTMVRESS